MFLFFSLLHVQRTAKARSEGRSIQDNAGIVAAFKAGIASNKIYGFEEALQLLDDYMKAAP